MDNDDLYHYGVPGMKWGVRRAQKQMSKLTGRDKSKISEEEANRFRKDVKTFKKLNKAERTEIGNTTLKAKYGKEYADAVMKQAEKQKVKDIIGKTAMVAAGAAAVGMILRARKKRLIENVQKETLDNAKNLLKSRKQQEKEMRKYLSEEARLRQEKFLADVGGEKGVKAIVRGLEDELKRRRS